MITNFKLTEADFLPITKVLGENDKLIVIKAVTVSGNVTKQLRLIYENGDYASPIHLVNTTNTHTLQPLFLAISNNNIGKDITIKFQDESQLQVGDFVNVAIEYELISTN